MGASAHSRFLFLSWAVRPEMQKCFTLGSQTQNPKLSRCFCVSVHFVRHALSQSECVGESVTSAAEVLRQGNALNRCYTRSLELRRESYLQRPEHIVVMVARQMASKTTPVGNQTSFSMRQHLRIVDAITSHFRPMGELQQATTSSNSPCHFRCRD